MVSKYLHDNYNGKRKHSLERKLHRSIILQQILIINMVNISEHFIEIVLWTCAALQFAGLFYNFQAFQRWHTVKDEIRVCYEGKLIDE